MMARAHPKLALRPFLPADAPMLAEIFRASVEELDRGRLQRESQREAWAATADDEAAFGARLAKALTLLGTMDGSPGRLRLARGARAPRPCSTCIRRRLGMASAPC